MKETRNAEPLAFPTHFPMEADWNMGLMWFVTGHEWNGGKAQKQWEDTEGMVGGRSAHGEPQPWQWAQAHAVISCCASQATGSACTGSGHPQAWKESRSRSKLLQQLPHELTFSLYAFPKISAFPRSFVYLTFKLLARCTLLPSLWNAWAVLYPYSTRKEKQHIIHSKSAGHVVKYPSFWNYKHNCAFNCNFEEMAMGVFCCIDSTNGKYWCLKSKRKFQQEGEILFNIM